MRIFDRRLHARRRSRSAAHFAEHSFLKQLAAEDIAMRISAINRRFDRVLDLGAHDGLTGRAMMADQLVASRIGQIIASDLSRAFAPDVVADEEALPFADASFDLVVSALSLHWVNDLPGALIQIRRALKPDGLFLASLPGLGTLQPLREALAAAEVESRGGISPRVSPFPELRDLAGLLQRAGFALPVADAEDIPLAYATPLGLVRDLRAAGETNAVLARDPRSPPRAMLPRALGALAPAGEAFPMPLRLLVMTGWAPHESQSKPARPGSANARLADALGTEERSAGEKPST
jgi:NADH dehydrogenase [ubiquinone] 1 alpha subcomplex assembly factor 5